ncbi:SurA N-terminal domain-containing protein [Primorskyibacter aestuariivivens]|uniref:peptidylprolyl isomerase n=1 Tax=Primorskyibacter aestuariivivens TaxID=1888912 RepID=UPI002301273A|nr:peptidylprolyl isomerase [Primorskyibacter aestuariivivens]MDA7429778.1 SurA N-terminal domain-containing protein [Primorskyibacter aestuariivivens]
MAKSNKISKTLVWILMGLLFIGLAGFGATNLSGTVRVVGNVGDEQISVDDYARELQQEIRAFEAQSGQPLTFQQAQTLGIPQQVISRLITTAALNGEAANLGISVGDATVAEQLREISAFQGINGDFDREAYRFALQNAGLSEAEFEEDLRQESARTLLQAAIVSGNPMPDVYGETLLNYIGETRDFTWAQLGADMLEDQIPAATEAQLAEFHEANIADYTLPEQRDITYAWVTPEMLIDTVEVDEAAMREAYEEQSDRFNQPERRLVERLVMPDSAAAEAAKADIETGTRSFEEVVAERGLELADIDMGDVSRADLGEAADAVFAAEVNQVVGPFPTDLGPALFRVNGILPALETPFEEAEPVLREQLAQDRARRVIDAMLGDVDDLLAGGATLEELAAETEMELGQINWSRDNDDGIAGYDAFRDAAAAVSEDDYPEVEELGDGGIFAIRLNGVNAPRPQTLDEVRVQVEADWLRAKTETRLVAKAEEIAAELGEGKTFEGLGLRPNVQRGQTRNGFLPGLPADALRRIFAMDAPGVITLPHDGAAVVIRLEQIEEPDFDSEESKAVLTAVEQQVSGGLSTDMFQALARDIQSRVGIGIDQQALNAVHANFQ